MVLKKIQHPYLHSHKYSHNNEPIGIIIFVFYSENDIAFEDIIFFFLKKNYICYTFNIFHIKHSPKSYIISLEELLKHIRLEYLDTPIFSYSYHICNIIITDFLLSRKVKEIHACVFMFPHIFYKKLTKNQILFYKLFSFFIPSYPIRNPFLHSDIKKIPITSFFYFFYKISLLKKKKEILTPILFVDEKNDSPDLQNSVDLWIKNKKEQKE